MQTDSLHYFAVCRAKVMNRLKNYHHIVGVALVLSLLIGANVSLRLHSRGRQLQFESKENKRPDPQRG